MKRRFLSLFIILTMLLSTIPFSAMTAFAEESYDAVINVVDGTGTGTGWTFASGEVWINENGSYLINGDGIQTSNRIRVNTGVTASVILNNVNINVDLPFECGDNSNVTVVLADDSNNVLQSWGGHAGLRVKPTAKLTISTAGQSVGNGSLSAYGGADSSSSWASAGIGGSELESSGIIVIDGGTIFAKGGNGRPPGAWRGPGAAGIGGAQGRSCGDITINGGTVTAIGGDINPEGAGIGGGSSDSSLYGGKITISGGTVRAYSGQAGLSGTGIGFCSTIAIADTAEVKAYSSGNYPAIYGTTDTSGHSAFLLNLMLDASVTQDTDITIANIDDDTEIKNITLLANYKNFAATVETADNYNIGLSDGTKKVVASADESTAFQGISESPNTAISFVDVKLKANPVCKIDTTEYDTLGEALGNAVDGDIIELLKDLTHSSSIITDNKVLNIDLSGYDLTVENVAGHALEAKNNGTLNILDDDGDGRLTVNSSGENKHCVNAVSGGKVNIKGNLTASLPTGAGSYQNIIGAYADGSGSTINLTGDAFGHMAGIYAQNGAVIKVVGNVNGAYYGALSAYNGSVDVTGNVSGSRALVSEYGGTATISGDIIGSNHAVETSSGSGWTPPIVRITGNVTGTGGSAISASNDGNIAITGNITGSVLVSGTDTTSPVITVNGDIIVNNSFGVYIFYGGTVTVNGRILGALPYLKLNNLDIGKDDYETSGDYLVYSNNTVADPAPFSANTVKVAIPQGGYNVTIGTLSGGSITANPTSAAPGTTVNLTITPALGKQLKSGTLKYNDGIDHTISDASFIMPVSNVTVTAEFEDTLINQAPVITSNWSYTTVYFGHDYPYTITVTDAENTSGTKIYSSLDGAGYSIAWTYPDVPGTQNMTLSPLKEVLAAGSHTLRYYAQDSGGAISDTLTLTFTTTDKSTNTGNSGGGGLTAQPVVKVTTTESRGSTITSTEISSDIASNSAKATITQAIVDALLVKSKLTEGTSQEDLIKIKVDVPDMIQQLQVSMPQTEFGKFSSETDANLGIDSLFISIVFDGKAVEAISGISSGGDIIIGAERLDDFNGRPVYDLTVTNSGDVVSDFKGGKATVTIPYTLKSGDNLNAIVIYNLTEDGKLKPITGHYNAALKSVVFKTTHFSKFTIVYNPVVFTDVNDNAWYKGAIDFIAARGITSGIGDNKFGPDTKLTRAQFVVLLMNAYQINTQNQVDLSQIQNFSDAGNTYYTNHLKAARSLGIVNGIGNNLFAPEQEITRQEMFVMLHNALKVIDEVPEIVTSKDLSSFNDANQIDDWANEAFKTLVNAGIVTGSNNKLNPTHNTTRAEIAQVLYNLFTK